MKFQLVATAVLGEPFGVTLMFTVWPWVKPSVAFEVQLVVLVPLMVQVSPTTELPTITSNCQLRPAEAPVPALIVTDMPVKFPAQLTVWLPFVTVVFIATCGAISEP